MVRRKLKKGVIIICCLVLIFGMFLNDPAIFYAEPNNASLVSNNVLNPGFEDEIKIPGWSNVTPDNTSSELSISSNKARTGSKSLYFYDRDDTKNLQVASELIPVSSGESYIAKAFVNVVSQSHSVGYEVHYFNNQNERVGTATFFNNPKGSLEIDEWNEISVDFTVPAGATQIQLRFNSGGVSITEVYFDDVSIELLSDGSTVAIANASFEDEVEIPGWTTQNVGENKVVSISTETVHSGNQSLYLHDNDNSASPNGRLGVHSDKIVVTPGESYIAKGYMNVVQQSHSIVYQIFYYDQDDKQVDVVQEFYRDSPKDEWIELVVPTDAPNNASYARIVLYSGDPSITEVYFDDISFIKASEEEPGQGPEQIFADLQNGSFELDLVDDQIQGWMVDKGTEDHGSIELSSKYARTGNNSLLFQDTVSGSSPVGHFRMLSNKIAVNEDDQVEYSIYVYKEASGDQSHGIQPVIHYYNENGESVKLNDFVNYGNTAVPVGEWYKLELDAIVPAETAYIRVGLYSGFPSLTKVYADDASINIVPSESGSDLPTTLTNPGFEDDLIDDQIPGWKLTTGASGISLSTDIVKSGHRSLHFKDSSEEEGLRVTSDPFAVTPGDTLITTANVYVISQTHNIVSEIYYYDESNAQVGSDQLLFPSDVLGVETWAEMALMSVVPENAVSSSIAFYSGGISLTEAYFDDISFKVLDYDAPLDRDYQDPVDLGDMTYVNLGQAGAIQTLENGENEAYFITNGKPGTFFAVDAETGKIKFQEVVPNTIATWAITIGPDKNVYYSGTEDGILYRYLPSEKRVEKLGDNRTDKWVWDLEAIGDKIYGGTFNTDTDGKVFEYDIITGEFRNYGVADPGQHYVRGIAVDDEYIYAGLGTTLKLVKIHRETGERTEIDIPGYSGTTGTVSDIYIYGGKLFVAVSTINMVVIDLETLEVEASFTQNAMISEPAPYDSNLIYFKDVTELKQYNIETKEVTTVDTPIPLPDTGRVKDFAWIELNSGEKAGQTVLAMITQYGEHILIDPNDNWMKSIALEIDQLPVNIQSLKSGFDGRLYMGGYQRGMSVYNPFTSNIDVSIPSFAQPEGIGFLNDKVYYGTYVSAVMYSYDPTHEVDLNVNPKLEFDAEGQDRPFAITSGDNKLFVGTVPDYGYLTGSLLIYDELTDEWSQYDNVVENQSIIGVAYKDGMLYGSTTVWGGLGIDPSEPEAKMFVWDVAKEEKVAEFTLDDLEIDKTPRMIGGLTFGPDGLLWGVVDGTIFAMDVETKSIVKSKMINPSMYNSSKRLPYMLEFAPDGMLYSNLSRKLVAIDPETLEHKIIQDVFVNVMTVGIDGSIYYAPEAGTALSRIAVPETDATLSAINIEGALLEGFSPGQLKYTIETETVPTVTVNTTQTGAVATIIQEGSLTEPTIVKVVGTDGKSTLEYEINWELEQEPPIEDASIINVAPLDDLKVDFDTKQNDLALPKTIEVTLSDDTKVEVPVVWDNGVPIYDGKTPGTYTFTGELDVTTLENIINPDGLVATINVVVLEEPEKSAALLLEELSGQLEEYIELSEVKGPLVNQLRNSLKQAEHHLRKGSSQKAVEFVEKFLKHMNNQPMQKHISEEAKVDLTKMAEALIDR